MPDLAQASSRRVERLAHEELDKRIDLLLAHGDDRFMHVTADPRKMGYLRFLLRHYAKSPHPWADCYKDNFKRFGPKTKGLCLGPDTPISTDHGLVAIADLQPGDLVWSYDGDVFVLKPVLWSGLTRRKAQVCRLEIENDVEVFTTPDHPFLRYCGEWAEAGTLRVGEFLLGPLLSSFPHSVDSRAFATASDAIALSLPDTFHADACEFGPQMPIGTGGRLTSLSSSGLDNFVSSDHFSDFLLTSRRHERLNDTHGGDGQVSVHAPVVSDSTRHYVVGCLNSANSAVAEDVQQLSQGLNVILGSDYASAPSAEFAEMFAGSSVPAKAPFSFEKSSGVAEVLGREVTEVLFCEELMDVWDIEVADTHNFLVHHFMIAHNCGVLKDTIRQQPNWRHGAPVGPHAGHPDVGAPGVAIGEADKWAAPAWGGHKLSEDRPLSLLDELDLTFGVVDHTEPITEVAEVLMALGDNCDIFRVLIGLDEPPHFEAVAA